MSERAGDDGTERSTVDPHEVTWFDDYRCRDSLADVSGPSPRPRSVYRRPGSSDAELVESGR